MATETTDVLAKINEEFEFPTLQDIIRYEIELRDEVNEIEDIEDDDEPPLEFKISSYGADYDVDGLVKRFLRGDILIPSFQRRFVWTQKEASRLVESLLFGLPIPGIFLSKDSNNRLLVIDGQQRIKSLVYYKTGVFTGDTVGRNRKFKLTGVHPDFENKMFSELTPSQQRTIDDFIIHATIVKQDSPSDSDTSIYYIFERLNNGGQKLLPQEIRSAIYGGNFVALLDELNNNEIWRKVFGKPNKRQKDKEAILRFFAFSESLGTYKKPLREFLNIYLNKNKELGDFVGRKSKFLRAMDVLDELGPKPFRYANALNIAFLETFMVFVLRNLDNFTTEEFTQKYAVLFANENFKRLCTGATSDESNIKDRFNFIK